MQKAWSLLVEIGVGTTVAMARGLLDHTPLLRGTQFCKENGGTLISRASHETEHLPPVLVAPENLNWGVADCDKCVRCRTVANVSAAVRVPSPGSRSWQGGSTLSLLAGLEKRPASLIQHGRSVPGSENYALSL